jgi:hypothetical protein
MPELPHESASQMLCLGTSHVKIVMVTANITISRAACEAELEETSVVTFGCHGNVLLIHEADLFAGT